MRTQVHLAVSSLMTFLGCSPPAAPIDPLQTVAQEQSLTRHGADRFSLYGLGSHHDERGCAGRGFRGFDFWVGDWNVYDTAGTLGGTNRVTREVSGCAVEEHWTDAAGNRGRSLNTYDAGTGRWHQLWMDASGLAIILDGESAPGEMVLSGDTPQSINGPIISNRITWTRLSPRRVRQFWEVSQDGRLTWSPVFNGDYRQERTFAPAPERPNPFCENPARVRFHWFDFVVGSWDVTQAQEPGRPLGQLDVTKDLSGCLLEWKFRGRRGDEGTAFAAFHFPTLQWHRTWIDEHGIRIAMQGALDGSSMVFTGTRVERPGVTRPVRATWTPVDADHVAERWETSADDGTTWTIMLELMLSRR